MDSTPMTTRTRFFALFLAIGLLTMAGCFGGGGGGGRSQAAGGDTGTALMGQAPMTIILDGSTDDWPEDQVAVGDQYYLYVRFSPGEVITPQANDETLVVSLDIDDSASTGLVSGDMGIDLEIAFSPPYEGDIGNGTFVAALTPDGEKIQLPAAMLDMTIAPSHASDWFEMRIGRLVPGENVLPREGLLTSGRVRGKMALFNKAGRRVAEAPEFSASLPTAARTPKRVRASIPGKSLGSVRLVSYNVLNASPNENPEPFARMLRALNPDVVLVQEWYDTPGPELAEWFNTHVPVNGRWRAVTGEGRGVAVISRYDLSAMGPPSLIIAPEGEDRIVRVLPALVETPIGPMATASVHLKCCGSLDSREDRLRVVEAQAIKSLMLEQTRDLGPHVRVVAGDYNLVGGRQPLTILMEGFDTDGSDARVARPFVLGDSTMYTWTSPKSRFLPSRLDYAVYSDSTAVLERAFVLDPARLSSAVVTELGLEELDAMSSDHRPVVMDLRAP